MTRSSKWSSLVTCREFSTKNWLRPHKTPADKKNPSELLNRCRSDRSKHVSDLEAPDVEDADHPKYRRSSKLLSLRCCIIFGIVMLCLAGRHFHGIFNDKSPKPQPNIANITARVENPSAPDRKLSPPKKLDDDVPSKREQLVKDNLVKGVAKNPAGESTTSPGGSTTSPDGQDLLGQQNTNEGGAGPARPSTQSTPKPPTTPSDALVLYDPDGQSTNELITPVPTPVPSPAPSPSPTCQFNREWDVDVLRKKAPVDETSTESTDDECRDGGYVVTIVDSKELGEKAREWREGELEACPLNVIHEIGTGHYSSYINHDDLMKLAPPFGKEIYQNHSKARQLSFDYNPRKDNPGNDFFDENGCVKPPIAKRIMDECRQAHKNVLRVGNGTSYHRSRQFAVTSNVIGCVEINQCVGALSRFSPMTRPSWLGRAVRNSHATPSNRRRVDGVEVDAKNQHERAVTYATILISTQVIGGHLKHGKWLPLQIMSRTHWETVPERTPILEKCMFDEAIRETGDDGSLLAPFDNDTAVIAVESKSHACRDVAFIEDEEERLDFLMWGLHKCVRTAVAFDPSRAKKAGSVYVQFSRWRFTGATGRGTIAVYNSEVVRLMMEDGSFHNNGMQPRQCHELADVPWEQFVPGLDFSTDIGFVGFSEAQRRFRDGTAACWKDDVLFHLRGPFGDTRRFAWKERPDIYGSTDADVDGPDEEVKPRSGTRHPWLYVLLLAKNANVEGVELATMDNLVDTIRAVAPVVYQGNAPSKGPVYTMAKLNLLTSNKDGKGGNFARHQQCAKSIVDALGSALVPCNAISEAKLHFCVQYPGMVHAGCGAGLTVRFGVDAGKKGFFSLPYHISAAAIAVFHKEKILEEFKEDKWKELRRDITEDAYLVLDVSADAWNYTTWQYKGLYAKESGHRHSGQAFFEEHSGISTGIMIPKELFAAFLKNPEDPEWPETKVERYTNYPRERGDPEIEMIYAFHEMVKKGLVLASELNATLDPLARDDEDLFSAEGLFYEAE